MKEQAKKEVLQELQAEHVEHYKEKLKALNAAKKAVSNLQREITDMEEVIDQEVKDINA